MLAESTAILLNVSEFDDATTASEALISTMQAFGYAAGESQHVVDILNEVGNNFAVSSDGLAVALQDSASALMEGGNSLEQAVALIAAANKVVQDPNSVGSALRTISLRLRGTSVEILEEMGEETDGVVESTSKLQEKLKALTGVDILTNTGAYKDTYTILREIGEVWDDLDPMDQAAALELMAGKNRANTLAAILNNMEDLEGAYEAALGSEGSAMRENEAYLDSIQGRIDLFTNALQTMWMHFLNDDALKFLVDVGTALIKLIDKVGLLKVSLAALAGYLAFKSDKGGALNWYVNAKEKHAGKESLVDTSNAVETKTSDVSAKSTTVKTDAPPVVVAETVETDAKSAPVVAAETVETDTPPVVAAETVETDTPPVVAAETVETDTPPVVAADTVETDTPPVVAAETVETDTPPVVAADTVETDTPPVAVVDDTASDTNVPSVDIATPDTSAQDASTDAVQRNTDAIQENIAAKQQLAQADVNSANASAAEANTTDAQTADIKQDTELQNALAKYNDATDARQSAQDEWELAQKKLSDLRAQKGNIQASASATGFDQSKYDTLLQDLDEQEKLLQSAQDRRDKAAAALAEHEAQRPAPTMFGTEEEMAQSLKEQEEYLEKSKQLQSELTDANFEVASRELARDTTRNELDEMSGRKQAYDENMAELDALDAEIKAAEAKVDEAKQKMFKARDAEEKAKKKYDKSKEKADKKSKRDKRKSRDDESPDSNAAAVEAENQAIEENIAREEESAQASMDKAKADTAEANAAQSATNASVAETAQNAAEAATETKAAAASQASAAADQQETQDSVNAATADAAETAQSAAEASTETQTATANNAAAISDQQEANNSTVAATADAAEVVQSTMEVVTETQTATANNAAATSDQQEAVNSNVAATADAAEVVQSTLENTAESMQKTSQASQNMSGDMANAAVGMKAAATGAAGAGRSIKILGVTLKAGSFAFKMFNAAATMGISLLASFAIEGIAKWLDEVIVTAEELEEKVQEITNTYKTAKDEFSDNLDKLTTSSDSDRYATLVDEFEDLAQGVNMYGQNISLAADEYNRYLDICNIIVGINPDIADGYNSAAEAIGNNASALSQLIEMQKEAARLNAAELVSYGAYSENGKFKSLSEKAIEDFDTAQTTLKNFAVGKGVKTSTTMKKVFDWDVVENDSYNRDGYTQKFEASLARHILETIGMSDELSKITEANYDDGYWFSKSGHATFNTEKWFMDYADEIYRNKEDIYESISAEAYEDLLTTTEQQEDFARAVLKQAGFKGNEVNDYIKRYTTGGVFDYNRFKSGSIDGVGISEYVDKYLLDYTDGARNAFDEWVSAYETNVDNVEAARDAMVSTFLQVPYALKDYDELSTGEQSFITKWISNNDMFKIDENTTEQELAEAKEKIISMVRKFANDRFWFTDENGNQTISASTILDQLFSIDTSNINFGQYRQKVLENLNMLWNAIGGENNDFGLESVDDLAVQLGFEFVIDDPDTDALKVRLSELTGKSVEEVQAWIDTLPPATVSRLLAYNWDPVQADDNLTWQDLLDLVNPPTVSTNIQVVATYSDLVEQMASYNDIMAQTSEIVADNTQVTEEYKKSLLELGISEEELNACFDENNKLVVKDAKGLNQLVKAAKNNVATNVRLAKSQAQLDYYELYQQMRQMTQGMQITDAAALSYVNSLYSQMTAIDQAISKYSMLEAQLLGTANAYQQLEEAKQTDEANDYGSRAEELVNILANAFNTSELGTQSAQVAIDGLVPDEVIDKTKTLDEQMQQVYDYFTTGEVSKLFTIEFDDNGGISSVEMTKENVQAFTEELLAADEVFHGTWDEFTLDDSIKTLDDFADALGVTKEVAFAYLTELEKYDIGWLGGDYETLLDQLMSGDLEYALMQNMRDLADLEHRVANGEISREQYNEEYAALTRDYAANREAARSNAQEWVDATERIAEAQSNVDDLAAELAALEAAGADESVIDSKKAELQAAVSELYNLQSVLNGLEEPTQLTLQIASEEIQEEIDAIEADLEDRNIAISAVVKKDEETGQWVAIEGQQHMSAEAAQNYANLLNSQDAINTLLTEGVDSAETHLSDISTTVANIYSLLSGENQGGENPEGGNETPGGESFAHNDSPGGNLAGNNGAQGQGGDVGGYTPSPAEQYGYSDAGGGGLIPGQAYVDPATISGGNLTVTADNVEVDGEEVTPSGEQLGGSDTGGAAPVVGQAYQDPSTLSGGGATEEVIPAEVDLDTAEAEEKIDELSEKTTQALTVDEILRNEGLNGLPLDNAFVQFQSLAPGAPQFGFDTTIFTQVLTEAGYTEEQISSLISTIQEYQNIVVAPSNPDPLGLNNADADIDSLKSSLDSLGVQYKSGIGKWFDGKSEIKINVTDLVTALKSQGWTDEAIKAYCQQLSESANIEGWVIDVKGIENIDEELDAINQKQIDGKNVDVEVTGAAEAEDTLNGVDKASADVTKVVTTKYVTEYHTVGNNTVRTPGSGGRYTEHTVAVNGTAHAQGTARKGGSWGAPQTETALTGELGPELRVRGNRWELLGENGAEFNEVRKGDIIFNHKQTEQLLSNGYITGRGKAFAEGTIGGSAFAGINTWDDAYNRLHESYSNTGGEELTEAADNLSDAADDVREVFDWIEVRLEEISEDISLKSAKLENAVGSSKQNAIIDDMIALNQKLYDNLTAGAAKYNAYAAKLLAKVPEEYRKAAQDGSIAIEEFTGETSKETLEAIQNYREWVQKGADATQQAEETLTEISNLAKQAIDNIAQEYENKASIPGFKLEQLEAYNALIETTQGAESAKIYQAMIKENNKQIGILQSQRNKMQAELNAQVEAGNIKKYSQAWYDAVGEIAAVDTEILNLTTDTEDYQDTINELHWEHFDNLISRFEAISDETENLIDILSNKDLVDKDTAEWTDEGITSLGLYAQQMEVAEMQAKKYKEEIQYLNKNWKKLGYTEQEYVEKLEELKEGQYDAIKSYNDTKDAIVDLTQERVDAIKEGIEKEIEAYEELISKKKEELNAEKDLYDFQKGVANQQKEIADIERKLAALSADNSASARAKRAQLEAELAEARQELEDTYYDRSVSNQQEALDKELEAFQEEKDKEMEGWDEYLEDTEKVVADGLATIQANTDAVYDTLQEMGQEYSLSIADALTSPWEYGENAIQSYSDKFKMDMSKTVDELKKIAEEHKKLIDEIETHGGKDVGKVNDNAEEYTEAENGKKGSSGGDKSSAAGKVSGISGDIQYGQSGANVKTLQKALNALGFNCGSVDGVFGDKTYAAVMAFQKSSKFGGAISADGIVGSKTKKKFKVAGYAGGTTGVKTNQLALIDELGEELVIRPSKGRMTFLEKGSAVIPADLTSNIMEWGELDPSIMLERNKPVISAPHVTNNNVEINMEFGEVVHIDTVTNDTIPNLTKAIEKQMDKYMKNVNNNIRKYAR